MLYYAYMSVLLYRKTQMMQYLGQYSEIYWPNLILFREVSLQLLYLKLK